MDIINQLIIVWNVILHVRLVTRKELMGAYPVQDLSISTIKLVLSIAQLGTIPLPMNV
jgi:hypothetical protein